MEPPRLITIELALTLSCPAFPVPKLLTSILAVSPTLNRSVLTVTSPEFPLSFREGPNACCRDAFKKVADEPKKLGLTEPGTAPLNSTDFLALMVRLPAAPVARVEVATTPPSRIANLVVLTVTSPAPPKP